MSTAIIEATAADKAKWASYYLNTLGNVYATAPFNDSTSEDTIELVRIIRCCECGKEIETLPVMSIPANILVDGNPVHIYFRGRDEDHGPASCFVLHRGREYPSYVCVDADKATPAVLNRAADAVMML